MPKHLTTADITAIIGEVDRVLPDEVRFISPNSLNKKFVRELVYYLLTGEPAIEQIKRYPITEERAELFRSVVEVIEVFADEINRCSDRLVTLHHEIRLPDGSPIFEPAST